MIDPNINPYFALGHAIAAHVATVPGVHKGIYPPKDFVEAAETPAAVVYFGSGSGDSVINMDMDGDENTHLPAAMISLMIPRTGNTEPEFGSVDELIWPICKKFNDMTSVNAEPAFRDLGFHVDKIRIPRWRGARMYRYGDVRFYGADFYLDIKFHG